jgi:hypothetical protein
VWNRDANQALPGQKAGRGDSVLASQERTLVRDTIKLYGTLRDTAMEDLTPFERRVIDAFLAGPERQLELLRAQAEVASVASRKHTVVGAYINFAIPPSVPTVSPPRMILGDVNVTVLDVEHGVTSLLFINSGRIDFLEFATFTGSWPKDPQLLRLGVHEWLSESGHVRPTATGEQQDFSTDRLRH